jgi:hypothetical protein
MKAGLVEEFCVDHLEVAEAADPTAGPGEVLVAMEAATVNPAERPSPPGLSLRQMTFDSDNSLNATIPCRSGPFEGGGC